MRRKFIFILLFIASTMHFGCKDDDKTTQSITDDDSIYIDNSEWVIDNVYTQIKNSMCDTIAFESAQYTNKNTQVYSLDAQDSTAFFIFVSEIDCGHPAGNCGQSIELIRKQNGKYVSLGEYCGKVDSVSVDKRYLYYSTQSTRSYKLVLNKKGLQSSLISIHGMPLSDLEQISKISGIYQDNLILKGEKTENLDAVPIEYKRISIVDGIHVNIYNVDNFGSLMAFAFLYKDNKRLQTIDALGQIEYSDKNNQKVLVNKPVNNSAAVQTWTYNPSKKIFSRSVYYK